MSALSAASLRAELRWTPLISAAGYDRSPLLSELERGAASELSTARTRWPTELSRRLARLTVPIDDVLAVVTPHAAWWGRYPRAER